MVGEQICLARPVKKTMLFLATNNGQQGEHQVQLVGAGPHKVITNFSEGVSHGAISRIKVTAIAKDSGTIPSSLNLQILDTDSLSASNAGQNLIYDSITNTVAAIGVVPDIIINDVRPDDIEFVTKGDAGEIQWYITYTGANGTTDITFILEAYGEAYA